MTKSETKSKTKTARIVVIVYGPAEALQTHLCQRDDHSMVWCSFAMCSGTEFPQHLSNKRFQSVSLIVLLGSKLSRCWRCPFQRSVPWKRFVRLPCQRNRLLESFPAANTFGERAKIEGVTGDGDGDISRQSKAFYCDFVACELYVKLAVIKLLVLLFLFGFVFFFMINFIGYF